MCLRGSVRAIVIVLTLLSAAAGAVRAVDGPGVNRAAALSLDDYLEAKGLVGLRAMHLERLLSVASDSDQNEIANRLARVYALLMETAGSEAERVAQEEKCALLLAQAPQADTLDLRLAMARAKYIRAEQVAERFRLDLASQREAREARQAFANLATLFDVIGEQADIRAKEMERQLEAGAPRDELMTSALGGARRIRSMASYLAGWTKYYMAELEPHGSDVTALAQAAQVRFGALLGGRGGAVPSRDGVAPDMLKFDHIARAALGVALSWSLRDNLTEALAWIDLVEAAAELDADVKVQVPARRMIVLARAGEWGRLASYVDKLTGYSNRNATSMHLLSGADARLLAALSLRVADETTSAPAARLLVARIALGSLIRTGQGAQAIDLIEPYLALVAADEHAAEGYLPRYLRALREYEGARAAHREGSESAELPTQSIEARRRYQAAASFVDGAFSAYDAQDYVDARPHAQLIKGLAVYFSADSIEALARAAERLLKAADSLNDVDVARASAARRLAIRAMDMAIEGAGGAGAELKEQRQAMIDAYIIAHPDDPASGTYTYKLATSGDLDGEQSIERLLLVDGSESLRSASRHEVGRLLYQRFLSAQGDEREKEARRFLSHASGLLEEDRRSLVTGNEAVLAAALLNVRRILNCALALSPPESEKAIRAFDLMASLHLRNAIPPGPVQAEFGFRSVQIALLQDKIQIAQREANALKEIDPQLAYSAQRELFRYAYAKWNASEAMEDAQLVMRHGRESLRGMTELDDKAPDPANLALRAGLARAAAHVWNETKDGEARELASILFRTTLRADPRNRTLLKTSAQFYEDMGDTQAALDAWRRLLSGLQAGSNEWFEAKVRVIAILVSTDSVRAREVLSQHQVLYPELGPSPWREKLQEIEKRLGSGVQKQGGAP